MTTESTITEGTYSFEGKELPEIEIHTADSISGPAILSVLIDAENGWVSLNCENTLQGTSSTHFDLRKAEEFFSKCLTSIREHL